jgi:hypothetical protein
MGLEVKDRRWGTILKLASLLSSRSAMLGVACNFGFSMQICIRQSVLGVQGFKATLYSVQVLIIWNFFEKLIIQDLPSYQLLEVRGCF